MEKASGIKTGGPFRPAVQLKSLYYTYFLAVLLVIALPVCSIVLYFAPLWASAIVLAVAAAVVIFVLYWIPRYYNTIIYKLDGTEIEWRRGVWFRQTGIVPYNRITNVDIIQGPVSRKFGIAALKIQTAGYSAPNSRSAEIRLDGIRDFEGLRETIMVFVRGGKAVAVETYDRDTGGALNLRAVGELVKIRKLLEKRKGK